MSNVLSKQESEFINALTLNEKSKNTVDKYARDIKDFILWSEGMGISATSLEKIDKEILIKYKLYLKDKYNKVSTVNSKISSINAFLEFSNMQNLKIKIIKCQKSLFGNKDRLLTKGELKRFLDVSVGRRIAKRKVAGYARVSTDNEEQQTSYKSQVEYYTNLIKKNPNWEFVDLFADEGISGTSTKHREGFNKMIKEALDGKIDLIITKSISRFVRNTVDALSTIRKLKEKNIEVYFEKENIYTLDSKGELMLSILSSLAQDESRSISENSTWGIRKRFADGYVRMRFYHFLGYRPDKNGKAKIVPEEAKVIKLIYKLFLQGYGYKTIARKLSALKIKSPGGTNLWRDNTVRSILSNERYKGDALLQKYYTVDFLNKKLKKNEGEVPQYYIENDHDAIVSKEMFDSVQLEMKNREKSMSGDIIGNKVICGYCGGRFGKKVWHSNDKYRKVVYRCNEKFNDKNKCESKILTEDQIKNLFMESLSEVITNKDEIIKNIESTLKYLNTSKLETEYNTLETALQTEIDKINNKVYEQAAGKDVEIDHSKYEELKAKLDKVGEKINEMNDKKNRLKEYVEEVRAIKVSKYRDGDFRAEFWGQFLDKMLVYKDKVKIVFKDGREVVKEV